MTNSDKTQAPESRRTITVAMDEYDHACKVITAYEALQSLRLLVQHEVVADKPQLQLEQVLSWLQVVEYAMQRAIEDL